MNRQCVDTLPGGLYLSSLKEYNEYAEMFPKDSKIHSHSDVEEIQVKVLPFPFYVSGQRNKTIPSVYQSRLIRSDEPDV